MKNEENSSAAFFLDNEEDASRAARDPLTPEVLLREIYASGYATWELSGNPSLPLDLFDKFFNKSLQDGRRDANDNVLAAFLFNSLTTFEQVVTIVHEYYFLRVEYKTLSAYKTVVEIFDYLIGRKELFSNYFDKVFMSQLLCSPLISTKDFSDRVIAHGDILERVIVCSDPRFNTRLLDFSVIEFEGGLASAIAWNETSSFELLVRAKACLEEEDENLAKIYENFNYPIELSAEYYVNNLDNYTWSPTILSKLEEAAHIRLDFVNGDGPWSELPLLWKLKAIAG